MAKKPVPLVNDEDEGDQTGLTQAAETPEPVIKVQKAGDFAPQPRAAAPAPKPMKRIRIILEDNEAIPPTGLFISPNGRPYLLMPSVEADVPIEVINVLNDAVTSVGIVDTMTQRVVGFRNRLRFPYQVVHRAAA